MKYRELARVVLLLVVGVTCFFTHPLLVQAESASSTLDAGFASGFRYSTNPLVTKDQVIRIYFTLQNQSTDDIFGTVRIFDNNQAIGDVPFSIVANRLIELWIDWNATPGPHSIRATITNPQRSEAGETPVSIRLSVPDSSVDLQTVPLPSPPATSTADTGAASSTTPTMPQPDPPDNPTQPVGALPTSTTSTSPADTVATMVAAAFEKLLALVKPQAGLSNTTGLTTVSSNNQPSGDSLGDKFTAILASLKSDLASKNQNLQADIQNNHNTEPILTEPIKAFEDKTYIKIPENKKPTKQLVYSWLISLAMLVLNTWWLMAIIFLLILRSLYKLWRAVRGRSDD